ncbi:MAG: hypothetical protein L6Q84_16645 [Polyangiaceae bacterium]|nr:hypothetical protein [Polyangiaceae bacterium]
MSRHRDLMRAYDGELTPEEAAELERSLSDEDRRVLAGLEQVGDVVRACEPEAVARFAGVADQVMAALGESDVADSSGPEVVVDRGPARPVRKRATSMPVVVAGLSLAIAAAVALWVTTPKAPAPSAPAPLGASFTSPTVPVSPSAPTESLLEPPDEDADLAATIEAVDFGNQPGSIFMVPAGDESTPVVWLEDEPAGARMEPL